MREGAHEFLTAGETAALAQVVRGELKPARATGGGTVVAVFPTKGGVGATSIATNLAGGFARTGQRTCLLDLDLAMGDTLAFLDLAGGYAISDLIGNMQRIDRDLLDASLLRHRSGVHVLAQTEKVEEAAKIQPAHLTSLIRFLTQHFRLVVVDGLRTLDDHAVAALDACDQLLLVVTQEVPAVRRAQRCVQFLRRLGHEPGRMKLLVNRFSKGAEIKAELIAETVGVPVAGTLTSDYPALIRAINRGGLLLDVAPRSPLAKDLEALGGLLNELPEPREKPGILKRLFG
jgi:pilus assembly protein CpaE